MSVPFYIKPGMDIEFLKMAELFKVYSCLQCDAIFTRSCKLEAHTKSHSQERQSSESSDYEGPSVEFGARRHANRRSRDGRATASNFKRTVPGGTLENAIDGPPADHPQAPRSPKPLVTDTSRDRGRRARDRPMQPSLPRMRFRSYKNKKDFLARWGKGAKAKYVCCVCEQPFLRLCYLKIHARIHTGFRPHVCDVCKKGFTQSSALQSHMRIHTGEKPYQCEICKKRFKESSKVTRHLRVHTGEKPYKCKLCGKSFTQSGSLKIHSKQHDRLKSSRDKGRKKKCTPRLGQRKEELSLRKDTLLQSDSLKQEEEKHCIYEPQASTTDHKNKIDQAPETCSEEDRKDESFSYQDSVIWLVEKKPEIKSENSLTHLRSAPCESGEPLDMKQSFTVCEEYTEVSTQKTSPECEINASTELESEASGSLPPECDSKTDEGTGKNRKVNAAGKVMNKILLKQTSKEACKKKVKRKRSKAKPKKKKRGRREISLLHIQTSDELVKEGTENSTSKGSPDIPKVLLPSTKHIENGTRLTVPPAEDRRGHQDTQVGIPEEKEESKTLFQHAEVHRNAQKSDLYCDAGTVQAKEDVQACTDCDETLQVPSLLNIRLYNSTPSMTSSTAFPSFEQAFSQRTKSLENFPVQSSNNALSVSTSNRATENMIWESDNYQYPLDLSKHEATRSSRQQDEIEPSIVSCEGHTKGKTPDGNSHNADAEKEIPTRGTFQTLSQRLSVDSRSTTQGYRSLNRRVQRKPKKLDEETLNEPQGKSKQTDTIRLEHPLENAGRMLPQNPLGMGQNPNFFRASPTLEDHAPETNHDAEQTKSLFTENAQRVSSSQTDQGLPESGKPKKGKRKHRVEISGKANRRTNEGMCKKSLIDVILYQAPNEEENIEEYRHADDDIYNKNSPNRESRRTGKHEKGKEKNRSEYEGSNVYQEQHLSEETARAKDEDGPQDLSWKMPEQERVSDSTLFYAGNDDISCVEVVVRTSSDSDVEVVFKEEDFSHESGLEPHESLTAEVPCNSYNGLCEMKEIPAMESTESTSNMYDERAYSTIYLTQEEPSQREDDSSLYYVQESGAHSSHSEHYFALSHSNGSGVPCPHLCAPSTCSEPLISANYSFNNGVPYSHFGVHSSYYEHVISANHNIGGGVPYPYPGAHTSYGEELVSASHNCYSGVPYPYPEDQVYQERIYTPSSYPPYNVVCHYFVDEHLNYYAVYQHHEHY